MNILIVEDVFVAREILKQMISRHGVRIDDAPTGSAAYELIKNNEYNFILIDLGLPDMCGIELIKKIRAHDNISKIIVTSGQTGRDILFKCINAGANHYLVKPIDYSRLKEIIFNE